MTFEGLDPQVLGGVQQQLATQAMRVNAICAHVDGIVRHALSVWEGPHAQEFHGWWASTHRPRLVGAAAELESLASLLGHEIQQQVDASNGGGGGFAGLGGLLGGWRSGLSVAGATAGGAFLSLVAVMRNPLIGDAGVAKDITEAITQTKGLVGVGNRALETEVALASRDAGILSKQDVAGIHAGLQDDMTAVTEADIHSGLLKHVNTGLGVLGTGMDAYTLANGVATHDQGQETVGGIGLTLDAMQKFPVTAPAAVAGQATLAVGEHVLPTSNAEYSASYDRAMQQHFGSAYNPNSLTEAQAQWGVQHYSGVGGFFNSIGDGIKYKASTGFGLFGG